MSAGSPIVSVERIRARAERLLARPNFDHIDGGVEDEATVAENIAGLARIKLVQKVLRNSEDVDTATTVLGTPVRLPVLLAPAGQPRSLKAELLNDLRLMGVEQLDNLDATWLRGVTR